MTSGEKSAGISNAGLRITALTVEQTAKILSSAGGKKIIEEMIRLDINSGAPVNADGTINLIHYVSWLVLELSSGD